MTMKNSLHHWLRPIGALALAVALVGCDDSTTSKGTGGAGGKGGSAVGGATGGGGKGGTTGAGGKANGGSTGSAGAAGGSTGTAGAAGGSTGSAGAAGGSNGGSTGTAGAAGGTTGAGGQGGSAAGGKGGSAAGGSAGSAAGGKGGTTGSAGGAGGASLAASLCPASGGMYTGDSQTTMTASDFCTLFLQECGTTTAGHTTLAECMTTYTASLAMPVHAGSNNGTIGACESYHLCNVVNIGTGHCQHAAGAAICTL
jgi:hypothetical protein